jgi:hypothetical protein
VTTAALILGAPQEENAMNSMLKRSFLLVGAALALGQGAARAADFRAMTANVPFPFVVENKTLPAGRYLLQRDDQDRSLLLIRNESGKRVGSYVLTYNAGGHDPSGDKPCLSFTRKEGKYELSSVWESRDDGVTVVEKK